MAQHHDVVGHASADDEYLQTPEGAGYEHTDASVGIIVKFMLWLAVAAVVIHLGLGLMFGMLVQQHEVAPEQRPFPLATGAPRLPPSPRLQRSPRTEFYEFRLQEEATLQNYGWVDRGAGTVHIPIAEAMRLTVERGLPSRPGVEPGMDSGQMAADSSSGRTMERRR